MRLVAFAALLAAIATPVQAGLRITSLDAIDDPLTPDLFVPALVVHGEADCASALARARGTGGLAVNVSWEGDLVLVGDAGDRHLSTESCLGSPVIPFSFELQAAVRRAAPAMEAQSGNITVRFDASPLDAQDPSTDSEVFVLRAKPLVVPQTTFGNRTLVDRGVPSVVDVTVSNGGNVGVQVDGSAVVLDVATDDEGLTTSVEVGSVRLERGQAGAVAITVAPMEGDWHTARVHGELRFTSLVEPAGEPRVVPFDLLLTKHRPVERNGSPAPGWPLLAMALALGVAVARRR